ncbi:MAG: hypothetical protein ABS938_08930 [Psychrobacillus psychrodurans]
MANGDLIKLGTVYLAGMKKARPTKPWTGTPPGSTIVGDIPAFIPGNLIEIRDTDPLDENKIYWREVTIGGKKLLISDRVLLSTVSWDDLHAQGLIVGKDVTIDGKLYRLRVLTGGSNYRTGVDSYSGATPVLNEWDQIIVNENAISGLPTPSTTDLDTNQNEIDRNSAHNKYWNWYYVYSWGQETHTSDNTSRVIRGRNSARFWFANTSSGRIAAIGWRPVLEVLETQPNMHININGVHKKVESSHVRIDDVWRKVDSVYAKINGVWRKS